MIGDATVAAIAAATTKPARIQTVSFMALDREMPAGVPSLDSALGVIA